MFPFIPIHMIKMEDPVNVELLSLFVFNSKFGPREGEEEKKILFFHPQTTNIDRQIKDVGLCEAICKFTSTFTDKDTESMYTQKTRQLFFRPEFEYWIVMTVQVPTSRKTVEDQEVIEYHEEAVQDSVYLAVLKQAYHMFRFFNGSFERSVEDSGVEGLRKTLQLFFTKYIAKMTLPHCDILDVFNGIHFLPLDKNTYLRIQSFINQLEAKFSAVEATAFLYNEQLVWSGLEQGDMRTLYRYLITELLPSHMEKTFQQSAGANIPASSSHYGRFIVGPPNIAKSVELGKIPRVFITLGDEPRECFLVVYRSLSATVCLLLSGPDIPQMDLLKKLDQFLGPNMTKLASDIAEQFSKRPNMGGSSGDPQYKYVYFNHMNLAQKTTIHENNKKSASVNIPPDIRRVIADLNHDLDTATCVNEGETVVKTSSDCWVVAKKSDEREFYVVLGTKLANLSEINEEVKRLCAVQFNNIFFLD